MKILRGLSYFLFFAAFAYAVVWRFEQKELKQNYTYETFPLNHEKKGMPVEIYTIKKRDLEVFEKISATPLTKKKLEAKISNSLIDNLKVGMKVRQSSYDKENIGVIKNISEKLDLSDGLYTVEIDIFKDLNGQRIIPLNVLIQTFEKRIVVPIKAVSPENNHFYVWKYVSGKALKQNVSLGNHNQQDVEITKGLKEGEQIIIGGEKSIEENDKLFVVNVIE